MKSTLSIRAVILSLGAASIVMALCLAGFGLLGMQQQLDARQRVVVLEQALKNHNSADAFMDSARTDVLRALQNAIGTNREGSEAIRTELHHHIETFQEGIAENRQLPMSPELHERYEQIAALLPDFVSASQTAVELALTDPAAGSANFEVFRRSFTALEELMDQVREIVHDRVTEVREGALRTAQNGRRMIVGSLLGGIALLAAITLNAVRIAHRITSALASSREQAQHLALHDRLTGLANRAFLAERLEEDLARARRDDSSLAMLCLDLDRFKQVNDTLGHPVGDALLRAVADRLRQCVRRSDTVARLGGDEFAIIQTPIASPDEAGSLAHRIVAALTEPYDLGEHRIVIGTSVGVAFAPADTTQADVLLKMADMALYRAKAEGRGTARFFKPEMDLELRERRTLELDLRRAIAMNEFELHYQPLVDVPTGTIDAMEALIRWRHPERGVVRPGEFIPIAEETGLITQIGIWVLHQACREAAAWPGSVRVAVNLSAAEFKGMGLVGAVTSALAGSGLTPDRLELEITETALITDTDATLEVLQTLRTTGVRIVLDDFGTGYSSLNYLRKFPFDKIKIDRSFVQDIETRADCKAIVRAVTNIGDNLGIATTAEGVETIAQFDMIQAHGCNQVQGYLFSRPVPAESVAALLAGKLPRPFAETWDDRHKAAQPGTVGPDAGHRRTRRQWTDSSRSTFPLGLLAKPAARALRRERHLVSEGV